MGEFAASSSPRGSLSDLEELSFEQLHLLREDLAAFKADSSRRVAALDREVQVLERDIELLSDRWASFRQFSQQVFSLPLGNLLQAVGNRSP